MCVNERKEIEQAKTSELVKQVPCTFSGTGDAALDAGSIDDRNLRPLKGCSATFGSLSSINPCAENALMAYV